MDRVLPEEVTPRIERPVTGAEAVNGGPGLEATENMRQTSTKEVATQTVFWETTVQ